MLCSALNSSIDVPLTDARELEDPVLLHAVADSLQQLRAISAAPIHTTQHSSRLPADESGYHFDVNLIQQKPDALTLKIITASEFVQTVYGVFGTTFSECF